MVDCDNAVDVTPVTSYQEESDDDDHYASMEESFKRDGLYTALPLYERFISKDERSKADEGDFAGKGKSFPILKPEDVSAAVHAMGRAGDKNVGMSTLKSRIISIAKRKGWTKYLPKSWQGDSASASESRRTDASTLKLCESWDWKEDALSLIESSPNPMRMKIKLIQAGEGSSAFYPAEVLKRDGPKVFTKGTHIYINHPTSAEEAARPEGDWHKLAGALDGNAYWDENGPKGAALYGEALFTSDHAPLIKEKASITGMSIRASGVAESGAKKNGKPVLKELTSAESVDIVTRAGAGGMILTEAARSAANQQEVEMTEADVKKLLEAERTKWEAEGTAKALRQLTERALRGDAHVEGRKLLGNMSLTESARTMVLENVLRFPVPDKDGALDTAKFTEAVNEEAKRVAAVLSEAGVGSVRGFGASAPLLVMSEADQEAKRKRDKRALKEAKAEQEEDEEVFARLLRSETAGKNAALKGVA